MKASCGTSLQVAGHRPLQVSVCRGAPLCMPCWVGDRSAATPRRGGGGPPSPPPPSRSAHSQGGAAARRRGVARSCGVGRARAWCTRLLELKEGTCTAALRRALLGASPSAPLALPPAPCPRARASASMRHLCVRAAQAQRGSRGGGAYLSSVLRELAPRISISSPRPQVSCPHPSDPQGGPLIRQLLTPSRLAGAAGMGHRPCLRPHQVGAGPPWVPGPSREGDVRACSL